MMIRSLLLDESEDMLWIALGTIPMSIIISAVSRCTDCLHIAAILLEWRVQLLNLEDYL